MAPARRLTGFSPALATFIGAWCITSIALLAGAADHGIIQQRRLAAIRSCETPAPVHIIASQDCWKAVTFSSPIVMNSWRSRADGFGPASAMRVSRWLTTKGTEKVISVIWRIRSPVAAAGSAGRAGIWGTRGTGTQGIGTSFQDWHHVVVSHEKRRARSWHAWG